MKKVTIMCRVSSDEQARGYSLDDQLEKLTTHCKYKGYEIVYIMREDHSAKTFDRPEWIKWMEQIKSKKIKVDEILFTSWDRFSRDLVGAFNMIKHLRGIGIAPQSIEQPIDYNIPENLFMLAMYLANPDVDNQRRSIKVKGGIRQGLKQGRWSYKAFLGYKSVLDENKRNKIVPDPEKAWIVQTIFEQVSNGVPQMEILKELKEKGVKSSRNNISQILRRKVYMGKIVIPANEQEAERIIDGVHEPLISEALFYKVQHLLDANKKSHCKVPKYSKIRDDFFLRGVINCNYCSNLLTASKSKGKLGKRYGYYHCNHCKKQRESITSVNDSFFNLLESIMIDKEVKDYYNLLLEQRMGTNEQENKQKINNLKIQLEQLEQRIEKMQDLMIDEKLDGDEYVKIKTRYTAQINEINKQIRVLGSNNTEVKKFINSSLNLLENLPKAFENVGVKLKQKIVGSIFPKLVKYDGKKCRTPKMNPVFTMFSSIDKGFSSDEKENPSDDGGVSLSAERKGLNTLQTYHL